MKPKCQKDNGDNRYGRRLSLLLNVSSGSYHLHYLNKLGETCKLHPPRIRMPNSKNEVKYKIRIMLFHYGFIVETQKYYYGQVTHTLLKTMSKNSIVIILKNTSVSGN